MRTEVQRLDRRHVAVGYGQHAHEFFEIVVFDSAGGFHGVSGVAERIGRGQLWMLPPGIPHDLTDIGGATGWLVLLGPEQLGLAAAADVVPPWLAHPLVLPFQQMDATGRPLPLRLAASALRRWSAWLTTIEVELTERRIGYSQAVAAVLHLLLIDAARICHRETSGLADPLVTQALELVDKGFRGALTLSDVADALHVTPGHLTETVRGGPVGLWVSGSSSAG